MVEMVVAVVLAESVLRVVKAEDDEEEGKVGDGEMMEKAVLDG